MHPGSPLLRRGALAPTLRALAALSAATLGLGCEEAPTATLVTSGTLSGVPFTVASGEVLQAYPDGPIRAEVPGAMILLDQTPAALGMSDPASLHLITYFALSHGGTLTLSAFGTASEPFGRGTAVIVGRRNTAIDYAFYVDSAVFADSSFAAVSEASAEHWLVTEFYADSVPGYGAGSGVTMWPLDDLDPVRGNDVLGCTKGPAMSPASGLGDRVALRLTAGFLLAVEVVDTIVGPCL